MVIFMLATGQLTAKLSQEAYPDRAVCKMMLPGASMAAGKFASENDKIKDYSLGCVNKEEFKRVSSFLQRMNHEWKKKYGQQASYNSEGLRQ